MNQNEFIGKYRNVVYEETGKWVMPLVFLDQDPSDRAVQLVLSANRNLEAFGRTMSDNLIGKLVSLPENEIIETCEDLIGEVESNSNTKEFQDAEVFYPDFPEQVMEMSEVEHYVYQISEYLGAAYLRRSLRPEFEATDRTPLVEDFKRDLKVIDVVNPSAIHGLMHDRMFSTATLAGYKKNTLIEYMHDTTNWYSWVHEQTIPNRENKAAIVLDIARNGNLSKSAKNEMLHSLVTEATDVVRLAAELSNGKTHTVKNKYKAYVWDPKKGETPADRKVQWRTKRTESVIANAPGLAGKVYFKLSRPETRMINDLLNDTHDLFTAVWLREDLFKSFARSITIDSDCSRLKKAFDNLFSGRKVNELGHPIVSPYSAVQKALDAVRKGDENALALTQKAAHDFPGVFSRNFVQFAIAGINHDQLQQICDIYAENAYKTPIREQLKVFNLVDLYHKGLDYRAIHIAKLGRYFKEDRTYQFTDEQTIMIKKAIVDSVAKQLQDHKDLGAVYIDPRIDTVSLPENGERTASKGSTLPSGSIIKGNENCNIIRQFIGWQNQGYQSIDIDTSAVFYNANLEEVACCSYYEHKANIDHDTIAVHGGDIVDAPVFSAEYMDIDKQKCKEHGIKYVVLAINSYSDIPFEKLDVAKFGFMQRQGSLDMNIDKTGWNNFNGQLFEPATVETLIDLNSAATTDIPLIYDVDRDEFIWVDKPLERERGLQNVANEKYMEATAALIHRYTNNYTPSLGDLVASYLYAGKAVEVDDPSQADVIFTLNPAEYTENKELQLKSDVHIVAASDFDYIASELMAAGSPEQNESDRVPEQNESDHADNIEQTETEIESNDIEPEQ